MAARVVARMLLKENGTYQCSGDLNWICDNYYNHIRRLNGPIKRADIQVPAAQMAHWILREAGYKVCANDLLSLVEDNTNATNN